MAHYFEWRYAFISLFFGGLFVAYLFFFPQSIFAANEVSITEDTTLVLPSDGSEYTLASGAQFDSLTINDDNFEFVMSSGGTATLSSSARRVFVTGDIDKSTTCSTDTSSIVVELDSGDSNGKKIFIRPSSETCPGSGGSVPTNSGGSSSGGGTGTTGSSPAAPSAPSQVEQQVTETPSLPILPVLPSGQTISALFSVGVGLGMTHSDIQRLQQLLNTDPDTRIADSGVGSPGNETNFFGSLTEKAVQKFQKKY
ncbi:MAG: peptidoglycan-binding domain-containing protein, partial [bacterium]|nr:peptidoglycan-binding domain-containing protein [bacterium]